MIEIVDCKYLPNTKEILLMETAMRIQEVFDDLWYTHRVSPKIIDYYGMAERYNLFCDWAIVFENKYCGTERYSDDWLELSREFAEAKIKEVFG